MASKNDETKKSGISGFAIGAIIVSLLVIIGAVVFFVMKNKGANANLGTPAPSGNAAVMSMPSPNNVSAGTPGINNAGRTGAHV